MDYQLAKKLKEVGYLQEGNDERKMLRENGFVSPLNNRTMWIKHFAPEYVEKCKGDVVYIPTLSELIEACGNEFLSLMTIYEGFPEKGWWAWSMTNKKIEGKTPEEAVAKLYIALKQKSL